MADKEFWTQDETSRRAQPRTPPLIPSPINPKCTEISSMAARTGKTILVVDDDLEVHSYFETILKIRGFEVLLADSGEEALRVLEEAASPIAMAILDVMMQGMDGIETATQIRRWHGYV